MASLDDSERDCLQRYCALLEERLGTSLLEVRMFGSAARGDMWPPHSPMHSDIDLLVVTADEVGEDQREAFINDTYPQSAPSDPASGQPPSWGRPGHQPCRPPTRQKWSGAAFQAYP